MSQLLANICLHILLIALIAAILMGWGVPGSSVKGSRLIMSASLCTVLQEMFKKEGKTAGPLLKAVYKFGPDNMARIEPGSVNRKSILDDTKAPRLYANLPAPAS